MLRLQGEAPWREASHRDSRASPSRGLLHRLDLLRACAPVCSTQQPFAFARPDLKRGSTRSTRSYGKL